MDRRTFMTRTALGGSLAASTLAAPAYAQGKRTLTMVTTWPRGFAGVHDGAQFVADRITALTDGQLTMDLKAAGELVGPFEVFDAVTSGQADMYHAADYYFVGQHPAYAFFTTVPFGMTAQELTTWYYQGEGQALHDKLGEIFGLKSFLAANTGAQTGGWFRKPIEGPEDFQGLRFRMSGLGGQALGKLGASVQVIPGSEVYQALSSGAIDGTEWIGPWADEKAGFQEAAPYYYVASFHEPGPGASVAFNREVYDSLTTSQKQLVETVCQAANGWGLALFDANNAAALARLQAGGTQLMEFSDDVWDAFAKASMETLDGYMDDPLFAEIRTSMTDSMKTTADWISRSERAYLSQRNRVLG
ncbi:TRAP transporter substrate-binding protein [Palleronia caenipelagi]|uniref:TRAP transporter substrate-binding protein n=1 Tax=Palleronia caenipelagi TaxID=2489174 RepID=A0A547PXL7_9RHOB|nr:TRAP transporter substrate-binding protein [Palleronia caenipelagi]TRD18901.1 TRAP transporter substrate-binding protein [Palleronia caenipelagi]